MEINPELVEKALQVGVRAPGIRVDRAKYLRRELLRYLEPEVVEEAIRTTPAIAGVSTKIINLAARESIKHETAQVSTASAGLGLPGGWAMVGTVPADLAQFFAHVARITQKLAYLYGWPDFHGINSEEDLDDATANQLIIFIGVMFGVNGAKQIINKIALALAESIPKRLVRQALTKGTIYPIVKRIALQIGQRMTKEIFAGIVGKAIPLVGAALSGLLTLAFFYPMSKRLQRYLSDLPLARNSEKAKDDNSNVSDFDLNIDDVEEHDDN